MDKNNKEIMRYFSFKGICVLNNEGKQVFWYKDEFIVGTNQYTGYYFDFHEGKVYMTRGSIINPTNEKIIGDVCDLEEINKSQAIELLKRKEEFTIVACKANMELFTNERNCAKSRNGSSTRYINDGKPNVAGFVGDCMQELLSTGEEK